MKTVGDRIERLLQVSKESDGVVTRKLLQQQLNPLLMSQNIQLSDRDWDIVLTYLSRDTQFLFRLGDIYKVKSDSITEDDKAIALLKTLCAELNEQLARHVETCETADKEARLAIQSKNRGVALRWLHKRKRAQLAQEKALCMLDPVEVALAKVGEAKAQQSFVKAMDAAALSLSSINKEIGGVEQVQAVMDKWREGVLEVDEISTLLSRDIRDIEVDDTQLEEELSALVASEVQEKGIADEGEAIEIELEVREMGKGETVIEGETLVTGERTEAVLLQSLEALSVDPNPLTDKHVRESVMEEQ